MGLYKFLKLKDGKIKQHDAKVVVAQKANGDPYERAFFANNKDLVRTFSEFGTGDWIEIQFGGKPYYNIEGAELASPPEATAPAKEEGMSGGKTKQQGSFGNVRRSDGTSRGDDTNRSAAIYLAERVVAMGNTEAQLRKEGEDGVLCKMVEVAEKIFDYISKGNCPSCSGEKGDPLDPPELDD